MTAVSVATFLAVSPSSAQVSVAWVSTEARVNESHSLLEDMRGTPQRPSNEQVAGAATTGLSFQASAAHPGPAHVWGDETRASSPLKSSLAAHHSTRSVLERERPTAARVETVALDGNARSKRGAHAASRPATTRRPASVPAGDTTRVLADPAPATPVAKRPGPPAASTPSASPAPTGPRSTPAGTPGRGNQGRKGDGPGRGPKSAAPKSNHGNGPQGPKTAAPKGNQGKGPQGPKKDAPGHAQGKGPQGPKTAAPKGNQGKGPQGPKTAAPKGNQGKGPQGPKKDVPGHNQARGNAPKGADRGNGPKGPKTSNAHRSPVGAPEQAPRGRSRVHSAGASNDSPSARTANAVLSVQG